jgi:hypothetical protein
MSRGAVEQEFAEETEEKHLCDLCVLLLNPLASSECYSTLGGAAGLEQEAAQWNQRKTISAISVFSCSTQMPVCGSCFLQPALGLLKLLVQRPQQAAARGQGGSGRPGTATPLELEREDLQPEPNEPAIEFKFHDRSWSAVGCRTALAADHASFCLVSQLLHLGPDPPGYFRVRE